LDLGGYVSLFFSYPRAALTGGLWTNIGKSPPPPLPPLLLYQRCRRRGAITERIRKTVRKDENDPHVMDHNSGVFLFSSLLHFSCLPRHRTEGGERARENSWRMASWDFPSLSPFPRRDARATVFAARVESASRCVHVHRVESPFFFPLGGEEEVR